VTPPPTVRVGREITAEERRRDVLRAAVRCVASSGYETVRLRDIAKEAGVSTGLLQHHFETREELLEQAFTQATVDLLDSWSALSRSQDPPWQRIVALVGQLTQAEDVRSHCIIWTEFAAAAARYDFLRSGFATVYGTWRDLLRRAVDDGVASSDFSPVLPVEDVVSIVLAHLDGCELAIASDVGVMTAERMHGLTLALSRKLLGYPEPG
jgi:AcrR family transcriptional regulator